MVRPADRRRAVGHLRGEYGVSERRACRTMLIQRSTLRYQPRPDQDGPLRARLLSLAEAKPRWGMPLMHAKIRREGLVVNHKRTERLYQELNLSLRLRRRKKRPNHLRVAMPTPAGPNQRWSMDFVFDQLTTDQYCTISNESLIRNISLNLRKISARNSQAIPAPGGTALTITFH